jgi:hypothetical protein
MKQFHFLKCFTMFSGSSNVCMSLLATMLCCPLKMNKFPFAISSQNCSLLFISSMTHKVCFIEESSMFTKNCLVLSIPCSLYSWIVQSFGTLSICLIKIVCFISTWTTKQSNTLSKTSCTLFLSQGSLFSHPTQDQREP